MIARRREEAIEKKEVHTSAHKFCKMYRDQGMTESLFIVVLLYFRWQNVAHAGAMNFLLLESSQPVKEE